MIENFPEWMMAVDKAPSSEKIKNRMDAISEIADDLSSLNATDMAKIILAIPMQESDTESSLRESFREKDAAFLNRGNSLEMSILVGTVLIKCWADPNLIDDDVVNASLFATCGRFGRNVPAPIDEILDGLFGSLRKYMMTTRRPHTKKIPYDQLNARLEELGQIAAGQQLPAAWPKMKELFQSLIKNHSALEVDVMASREESQFAWWLLGNFSSSLDRAFDSIDGVSALVPLADELVSMSTFDLPPVSTDRILLRGLESCKGKLPKKTNILNLVEKTPKDWKDSFSKKHKETISSDLDLFPLSRYLASPSTEDLRSPNLAIEFPVNVLVQQAILELGALSRTGE